MANGNIETIPYQTGFFTTSINNINNINTGLKAVMEEQLKSERLKTELITNVSHDLKTPLTSIISYVDLLQAMNLDNEKANEYIGIIKNKSRRLKILIDDLFEASKLSSGQMKLEKEMLMLFLFWNKHWENLTTNWKMLTLNLRLQVVLTRLF